MKTLYYNGTIITMNPNLPKVDYILVENGKIVDLGFMKDFKETDVQKVDLNQNILLPGFIDSHSHFVGLANSLSQCDLSQAKNFKEIVSLMKEFIKRENLKDGDWVYGCNYDHNFLEEKQHPTKEVLNEISIDHPVVIVHASSHLGVANDKAFEVSGIDEDVKDPEGGSFGRKDGKLTGYMEENAFINFQNKAPMISVERLFELMKRAQDIYASYGITTIQEGMVQKELWQLLDYANRIGILKLDVVAYIDILNHRQLLLDHKEYLDYQGHLKIGGYKMFLDGSPQGRTAYMTSPYEGSKDYCGYPTLSQEKVNECVRIANLDHQQILAHCNGDGACEQFIRAFENTPSSLRPVMVHAQLVTLEQIERMAKIAMIPSFFVAHTYYWGDIHIENFGYERAKNICPVKKALDMGLPYTFHQDCPVLLPDMVKTLECATQRITRKGVKLNQEQCINMYEALQGITTHGAYQYFEEDEKGSLEVSKRADLVIIDPQGTVLETIKDGQTIYKK